MISLVWAGVVLVLGVLAYRVAGATLGAVMIRWDANKDVDALSKMAVQDMADLRKEMKRSNDTADIVKAELEGRIDALTDRVDAIDARTDTSGTVQSAPRAPRRVL